MKSLRYMTLAAVVGLALASDTGANPIPAGPGCSNCSAPPVHGGYYGGSHATLARAVMANHGPHQGQGVQHRGERLAAFFHRDTKPKLPVFQAAPWYNYWPYDGHFQTPAPIGGQFYGPPMTGNFPTNPYFPGAGYGGGFGGPIPGGPPPGYPMPMPR